MIYYGDPKTTATVGEAALALEGLKGRDFLIANGMLEQALADAGLEGGAELPLARKIEIKTPEGFAFYGLFPEQYAHAARKWLKESGFNSGQVVVIGIRSIGTTLSRVVCQEIERNGIDVRRCTVRPEGDAFQRSVKLPPSVDANAAAYLIVDEGPGQSGSSFVAVSSALRKVAVNAARIHFFPGHAGMPGPAASEEIRRVWKETKRWIGEVEKLDLDPALDWQYIGPALPWPFDCSGEAERLARKSETASCGVPVLAAKEWHLGFRRIQGEPVAVDPAIVAQHIRSTAEEPFSQDVQHETEFRLREMLIANVDKHFGNSAMTDAVRRWLDDLTIAPSQKSSGDGRLGPENWIRDRDGKIWKLKTTGMKLTHSVAYRLPIAWDIANAIVEWDWSGVVESEFLQKAGKIDPKELAFFKMANSALSLARAYYFGGDKTIWERRLLRAIGEQMVW